MASLEDGVFGDGKDAGALRSIGEVCAALAIKPHVLRYWEDQFAALRPLKRAGGRRLYRPEDVALAREIHRLINHEGYTLRGAKVALGGGSASGAAVTPSKVADERTPADPGDVLPRLKAIRSELAAALAA